MSTRGALLRPVPPCQPPERSCRQPPSHLRMSAHLLHSRQGAPEVAELGEGLWSWCSTMRMLRIAWRGSYARRGHAAVPLAGRAVVLRARTPLVPAERVCRRASPDRTSDVLTSPTAPVGAAFIFSARDARLPHRPRPAARGHRADRGAVARVRDPHVLAEAPRRAT